MMSPERDHGPELLLPAGELPILQTAVDNGADAVYLGAAAFSARGHAANFDDDALAAAVAYAHERSSRIYLALNTLIADEELADALDLAVRAAAIGVDALILQDIGLACLIGQALPGLPLHASTQMTIYDESMLPALKAAGFQRIILPREFSLPEVAAFTRAAHAIGMETEMFVHGALCVCYSGQCLFSSLTSGRSGNRGVCAQPCRLSYRLREDGRLLPAGACLSPKDQAAYAQLEAIAATGVDSLKVEGRMRSAAYVAQAAATYRSLLDDGRPSRLLSKAAPALSLPAAEERLLLAFNRGGGFTDRAFTGRKDRSFLSGAHVGSHGILIGTVAETRSKGGILALSLLTGVSVPERGDVLSVRRPERRDENDPAERMIEVASAPIGTAEQFGGRLHVQGFHPDVLGKLRPGDQVYRMNSARADQAVLSSHSRRTPIAFTLSAVDGTVQLSARVTAGPFLETIAVAAVPIDPALTRPLQVERIHEQLAKTGGTPYLAEDIAAGEPVALSIGSLNQLRRQVLAQLSERLAMASRREVSSESLARLKERLRQAQAVDAPAVHARAGASMFEPAAPVQTAASLQTAAPVQTAAFFYRWPDTDDALACGADAYLLPAAGLESPSSREQLAALRAAEPQALCVLVLPPAAAGMQAEQLRQWRADGTLRLFDRLAGGNPGLAALAQEAGIGFEADATANIYNHESLAAAARAGARAICPSPELTDSQRLRLAALAAGIITGAQAQGTSIGDSSDSNAGDSRKPAADLRLDWLVHGRERLMYTAYCPVGSNIDGCHRCQGHRYQIQDRKERQMPLLLHPPYCTATILNADSIVPPASLTRLVQLAPARLRLLFLDERQAERRQLLLQMRQRFGAAT